MRYRCVLAVGLLLLSGGCARYFEVTQPEGGRVFYTTRVENQPSGAIKFINLRDHSKVTLQSSQVREISRKDLPPDVRPE